MPRSPRSSSRDRAAADRRRRLSGTPHEVTTGVLRGSSLAGRVIRVLSFFTIQSNILCGVAAAQLAVRPDRDGPAWRPFRVAALCGIAVTGIVYSAVLADIHQPHGAMETTVNVIVHYVVPIMTVHGWLLFGPRPRLDWGVCLRAAGWPLAWLAVILVSAEVTDWYPYPFLDHARHGWGHVIGVCAGIVVLFFAIFALMRVYDRRMAPAPVDRAVLLTGS
jgi:hypothetical protein